ncbi:hypothetical protein C8F04DRAFT_1067571, partial [Mycena alexandri]
MKLDSVLAPGSSGAKEFFDRASGFPVGIAALIEQPISGVILWGITNNHRDRTDELGWLIPVLNEALCSEYEQAWKEEDELSPESQSTPATDEEPIPTNPRLIDIRARRAQLGSLIGITFIHEGMHAYLRWRLGDCIDPATFNTLELNPGQKCESGWELEYLLFRGIVHAQITREGSEKADRFRRIENLWLQVDSRPATKHNASAGPLIDLPPAIFRLISNSCLADFHNHLLQSVLTTRTLAACFQSKSTPLTAETVVCANNRVLLRIGPALDKVPEPRFPPLLSPVPHCGLALERFGYGPDMGRSCDFGIYSDI